MDPPATPGVQSPANKAATSAPPAKRTGESSRLFWSMSSVELTIRVPQGADRVPMLGVAERNLKMIREALGVNITARDGAVQVAGDPHAVEAARRAIDRLDEAARLGEDLSRHEVLELITQLSAETRTLPEDLLPRNTDDDACVASSLWDGPLDVYVRGRRVSPKSANQRQYLDEITTNDLILCAGPAGTGKTYLAVAAAVHMLKAGAIRKIVLVRPAVEAGEKLGFLPGDLEAKVNPYLRPLLDALHDMMDFGTIQRFMLNDIIEIAPLAFMRGRTLNDAVIILDEAQNTTRGQMKMFLTRLGQRSKMIVTGDTTQIDLPDPRESGLVDAARRLARVKGVGLISLDTADIVRHDLVQRIVDAYGSDDRNSTDKEASAH